MFGNKIFKLSLQKKNMKENKKAKKIKPVYEANTIYLNRMIKPILFFLFAFILEIISFGTLAISSQFVKFTILPEYFWFDVGVFLVLTAILYLCAFVKKPHLQTVFYYIFLSIQIALNVLNSIILKSSGSIFDFQQIMLLSEGVAAFNYQFINILAIFLNVVALAVIITSQILLDKFVKKSYQVKMSAKRLLAASLTALFAFGGCVSYGTQEATLSKIDSKYYWNTLSFKLNSLQKFGTYGFFTKDFYNTFLKPSHTLNKREILAKVNESIVEENPYAKLYGDNLIMVMLESFDWFAIDPYNTPTLYKLYNEGVACTNYVSNNKTNVSEDMALLGHMPDSPLLSLESSNLLTSKYSLPNNFDKQGYKTTYFHSYTQRFYDRNVTNKNIGFDSLYFLEDAAKDSNNVTVNGWNAWNSEVDFFEACKNKIAPTDGTKFMSFYLTVATHGAYDFNLKGFNECFEIFDNNLKNSDYLAWFETQGFRYPTDAEQKKLFRQYMAVAIDTDRMLAKLLEHLNTELADGTKLIDNTTLLLFSDHNVYYHDMSYNIKNTNRSNYADKTHYTVPFILYSQKLNAQKIDDFRSSQDIYPTVCSLFGLEYSAYMCQGYSIFDFDNNHVYYSQLTGYYNKYFYSLNMFDMFDTTNSATKQDRKEFFNEAEKFYQKQIILTMIYKSRLKA